MSKQEQETGKIEVGAVTPERGQEGGKGRNELTGSVTSASLLHVPLGNKCHSDSG